MIPPLLKTKLHIPPVRPKQVQRPRLFKLLNAGLQGKMILVSAPAGFGKTNLISSWLRICKVPGTWFSVGSEDNDPARFWSYFITSLQSQAANAGDSWLPILRSALVPPIEALLSELLNEMEELENRFVVVLDDFHVIENQQILDSMLYLVENLPPSICLVLSTRSDPPWPMARLRGQGEITEVRIEELRFTLAEASEFISSIMGVTLLPEEMNILEARTEGWVAGLQLASLSLKGYQDKTAFFRNFSGSNRFILDYLLEEVLDRQPPEIFDFLQKTSILDRMCAGLCDSILEVDTSQAVLSQLERDNLFLIPLDDERLWYRYHHLFADLMKARCSQLIPEQMHDLYHRASEWFETQNMLPEAISFALQASERDRAAKLIETNAFPMIHQGQLATLVAWITSLPADMIVSRPWLSIALAWAYAYSGNLDRVESACQAAEGALLKAETSDTDTGLPGDGESLAGHIAAIRGYCALVLSGNLPMAEELTRQALSLLPGDDFETREFARIIHSVSIGARGDLLFGEQALAEPAFMGSPSNAFLKIFTLSELAILCIIKGQLNRAADTCQNAILLADQHAKQNGKVIPIISFAYSHLSAILAEWNRLDEALSSARKAVEISQRWGQKDCLITAYPRLAFVLSAAGNREEAYRIIKNARQVVDQLSGRMKNYIIASEARLHLANGDIEAAGSCFNELGLSAEDAISYERVHEYRPYAWLLVAQGQYERGLSALQKLSSIDEEAGGITGLIEDLLLTAMALFGSGEKPAAIAAFSRALDLAEPEGYCRIFIKAGETGTSLIKALPARRRDSKYVKNLLAAFEAEALRTSAIPGSTIAGAFSQPQGLVDQLTPREIEVLSKLATSASIESIADELCITESTLRTHIRNVYDKLGVHSRLEAAALARASKNTQ